MAGEFKPDARARVTNAGLELGEQTVDLISGEVHYFQHEPADWPRLLDGVKELGVSCVSSYVPWGAHEISEGRFDFGDRAGELDIAALARLVAERELLLILRPGPHINAELTWLGYPKRLLARPEVMARTPAGNPVWLPIVPKPMPIPSYASEAFLEEADRWLTAVGEQLAPLQWPEGPLVAVQLDNEAPLVFRNGPFDQDYHPDARALFREVAAKRGRPREEPPTMLEGDDRSSLLTVLDWLASRHEVYARAFRGMRATLEAAGLERVVYYHNIAQGGAIPEVSPEAFDAVDAVGYDFYHERRFVELLLDRCAYVVGSTTLPFAAEMGIGGPWNLPARSAEDALDQARVLFACGLRAANFFMLADRDRYFGAPLDVKGVARPGELARGVKRLIAAIRGVSLHETRVADSVVVVVPRIYSSLLHATWCLGPIAPPALTAVGLTPEVGVFEDAFGLSGPAQIEWPRALSSLTRALRRAGLAPLLVDGDSVGARLDELRPAQVVVLCHDVIESGLWRELRRRADEGLAVIVGPRIPSLDEHLEPFDPGPVGAASEEVGEGGGVRAAELSTETEITDFAESMGRRVSPRIRATERDVFLTSHVDERDRVRLVGVVNRASRALRVTLESDRPLKLVDVERGSAAKEPFELRPGGARLLRVEPEG